MFVIKAVPQTGGNEACILASSVWGVKHVFMTRRWKQQYPEFANQLLSYQKKSNNKHDGAPDVLAAIYEAVANPRI